eukprot:TRINITY_DN10377_c0_g1_i1.p1 TRINITY_DN10377_c0_g1~~TRINITY_DN10377_c0_g1_i1.p1  ORF type:complete len:203 (-),score=92.33 TRINITY_DN10377_c0_g1_i1:111-719(-)
MEISKVIDFTEVEPIPVSKTVAYVNNFIINTVSFLNKFSNLTEEKLCNTSQLIQKLEISMALLEAKLSSIPEVPGGAPAAPATTDPAAPPPSGGAPPPPPPPPGPGGAPPPPPPPPSQAEPPKLKLKDDPRYIGYFKKLQYRVPLASIQNDMMIKGLDPTVLERPDDPSDYTGPMEEEYDKSEESDGGGDNDNDDEEDEWSD